MASWYDDYLPDDSPLRRTLDTIQDPVPAISRGMRGAGDAVNKYFEDVSTAAQPQGLVNDVLGFLKEKITADPTGKPAAPDTPLTDLILNSIRNVANFVVDPENPAGSITSMAPIGRVAGKLSPVVEGLATKIPAPVKSSSVVDNVLDMIKSSKMTPEQMEGLNKFKLGEEGSIPLTGTAQPFDLMTGDKMALEFAKTRELPAIERIALKMQGGPLADMVIAEKQQAMNLWRKAASESGIPYPIDPPAPPEFSPNGKVVFKPRDEGLFDALGTPMNTAARTQNLEAFKARAELSLTEAEIKKRITHRNLADSEFLDKVSPKAANALAESMRGTDLNAALTSMNPQEQQVARYIRGKFDSDRKLIQTRLRELVKPQVEKRVRERYSNDLTMTDDDIARKVEESVNKRVPDSWGINDYLPEIFPGDYVIKDNKGSMLDTARTRYEAKSKIASMVENGHDPANISVSNKTFVDPDLLKGYSRGSASFINELTDAAGLTKADIARAATGDLGTTGQAKFWSNLMKRGKSPGFEKDIKVAMDVYNRGIERWVQLSDMSAKVEPVIKQLNIDGFPVAARNIEENVKALWGYRNEVSQRFDNELQRVPFLRNHVAPLALERWGGALKSAMVNTMIKYKPSFHVANSSQLMTTLWPIAGSDEIYEGIKLFNSKSGKEILDNFGIGGTSKVGTGVGPIEDFNQAVSFLTMYNRSMKLGLDARQAGDYAFLRGNIYSQFHSLMTDRPTAFLKFDPTGAFTLFQRFGVKQVEQLMDLVKDRHVSGAAKWLTTVGLMGGARALTFGGSSGWLGYQGYKMVEDHFGKTAADTIHYGLPGMVGIDMSNTAMAINPPFGSSLAEKLGTLALGPLGSISSSAATAAFNTKSLEPNMGRRVVNAMVQRLPLLKEADSVRRIVMDDYDIMSTDGKLKYKADVKDLLKMAGGFRPVKDANLTMLADAITAVRSKRDGVIDYAASRRGQAKAAGVALPKDMEDAITKEVTNWNALNPEMPITGTDIAVRVHARVKGANKSYQDRLLKSSGKVGKAFRKDMEASQAQLQD